MKRCIVILCACFFTFSSYHSSIHIFGDSHSFFCFTNSSFLTPRKEVSIFTYSKNNKNIVMPFYIHWLGPVTMFRIGREGLEIERFNISTEDIAVFVFGEIDVRAHIVKQVEKGRKLEEVIHSLVTTYIDTIKANKLKNSGIKFVVVSILPPTDQCYNSNFPFEGPLMYRIAITQALNKSLKKQCQLNEIYFLDIYSLFAQKDGSFNTALSDKCVHVHPRYNKIIKEKLIELVFDEKESLSKRGECLNEKRF